MLVTFNLNLLNYMEFKVNPIIRVLEDITLERTTTLPQPTNRQKLTDTLSLLKLTLNVFTM